jgi:hypothetical protein
MPPKKESKNLEAYCMKCKSKTRMVDGKMTTTARGTSMMKGKCNDCGTTTCRIVGKGKKEE